MDPEIEAVKRELEQAYARLRSLPPGDGASALLERIEALERELLVRYEAFVEKRDSTLPPRNPS